METRRFPYRPVSNARGQVVLRPILSLTLRLESDVLVDGLLDTGADVNILPFSMGIELGAKWSNTAETIILSGNLANYEAQGLVVDGMVGQLAAVRLAFAWTQADHVPVILGQFNFFKVFDVCFYGAVDAFEIRARS